MNAGTLAATALRFFMNGHRANSGGDIDTDVGAMIVRTVRVAILSA